MAQRDMKALEALNKVLAQEDKLRDLVATSLAEECIGLIKQGYRTENDPYGRKWVPKKVPDGRKTLSGETSRLKTGWHIKRIERDGIEIAPSVDYMIYHQDPRPRERLTDEQAMERSLSRGFTREQVERSRQQDSSFVGPMALTRPRRMQIPDEALGLPEEWERDLNECANDALAAIIGGDGRRATSLRRRLRIASIVGFQIG